MYDVVVIGAGLAGLQVARLVARGGASVFLADARRNITDCVRTTGIFVRRTFEDFSWLHPFLGAPIRSIGVHSPRGQRLEMTSDADEFRVGRMKPLYEAMLQQAVAAGARWSPATTYARMHFGYGHTEIVFRDGTSVRARYVVGADGARSRVARDLGLDENYEWITGVENVYRSAGSDAPRFDCWIDPKIAPGYLAWVIDDGEEIHIGVGGDRERFDPMTALRTFESRVPRRTPIGCRGGLIPVNGILRRIGNGRGLLVGDAAGAVSPLTAGGLDACMRLSAHAARVLLDAPLRGYDGSVLRQRFASRIAMRRIFGVATRSRLAIELGFAMGRTPMANRVVRYVFFGRGSFPDLPERRRMSAVEN